MTTICDGAPVAGAVRALCGAQAERGLADMNDLELWHWAAARADLSGWVQERLDARIRHLLIDEFQDTSPLQWHALQAWLRPMPAPAGGAAAAACSSSATPSRASTASAAPTRVCSRRRRTLCRGAGRRVAACDHTRRNAPGVVGAVNASLDRGEGDFAGFRRAHHRGRAGRAGAGVRVLPRVERPAARAGGIARAGASADDAAARGGRHVAPDRGRQVACAHAPLIASEACAGRHLVVGAQASGAATGPTLCSADPACRARGSCRCWLRPRCGTWSRCSMRWPLRGTICRLRVR